MMKRERRGEWELKRRYSDQRNCKRRVRYSPCVVSQGATLVERGSEDEEGAKKEGDGEEGGEAEDQAESAEKGAERDEMEEEEEERVISYDYEEMKSKPEIVSLTVGSMLELQYPICVTVLSSTLLSSSPLSLSPPSLSPHIHPFLLLFLTSTSYSFGYECQKRSNLVVLGKEVVAYAAGNLLVLLNLNSQEQAYRRTLSGGGIGAIAVSV